MTDERKALRSEIIDVQDEVNRAEFETLELQELLEWMAAGNPMNMPVDERLHRTERLIDLAARIAKASAERLDKLGNKLDELSGSLAGCAATTEADMALSADEADFLASYRNCSKEGQKAIGRIALAARNGIPADQGTA
jgi:hypothetical protein